MVPPPHGGSVGSRSPYRGGRPPHGLFWLFAGLLLCGPLIPPAAAQPKTRSPHGALRGDCEDCHSSDRWTPILPQPAFRHDKLGFPLEGSHARVDCRSCHKSLIFNQVGAACVDCHKDPHKGQLGSRCDACHTPRTFQAQLEIFKVHDKTRMTLFAIHAAVPCDNCHAGQKTSDFPMTPTACAACHQRNFQATKNPSHARAGFTQPCETCHLTASRTWKKTTYTHAASFPLRSAHATLACATCHEGERFAGTPKDCVGCHLQAFNTARNPSHLASNFPTTCAGCHKESSWRPATFTDHGQTHFPLTGAHQRVDCTKCHPGGRYTGTSTECVGCHQTNFQATRNPNHTTAGIATTCASCHSTDAWQPASFDHDKTRFALAGAHQKVPCTSCHNGGRFKGTSTECFSCHNTAYQKATNPNHLAAGFPTQCSSCHSASAWRPASAFDHGATRFPLTGAHQRIDCTKCHAGGSFSKTPTECFSCHQAKYQATKNPNHVAGGLPTTCASCHSTNSWRPATMVDHNKTRFPLTGAHQRVDCAKCHAGGKYKGTATECVACHQANFQATKDPNHVAGGFSSTCASCHSTNAWRPASFTDHGKTRFALTGAHQRVECAKCHLGGKYTGTSMECVSCHQAKFQATRNPNHVTAGFPTTCASCHTTNAWAPAQFDHGSTRFPLLGAHQKVECLRCHVGGKYTGASMECVSCHQAKFQATRNPNHVAGNFPTSCATCHTTAAWRPASFTDHGRTRFPLTGAHQGVECAKCHVGGKYTGTSMECVSCHQAKFQATRNPNHVAAKFPTTCVTCHSTSAWTPATFNHSQTRFPLLGAHQKVECLKCHVSGKYAGTSAECVSCHRANYDTVKNPDHVASSFPTTCSNCHTTNAWRPASFTDHSKTRFPLTGVHQSTACEKCHVSGRYTGTPTDCYACHQANFQATKNPGHVTGGFPTTCTSCHSTKAWAPATFDHGKTRFPLTGSHQSVVCAKCHVGGQYAGTSTDCYACHQGNFQRTTNPGHVAGNFPTTCASCHTTNGWRPASFTDHGKTRFPLTGAHQGVACAQCHVGGKYTGTPTDCVSCHQAKYQATRNPNHVAAGFPTTCASCHTTNGWTPATFDHNKTRFPLTGLHRSVTCAQCHVGGKYTGTSTDCYACHQGNFQRTTNPSHVAGNFPTTCASCHTTNGWRPATFSDHNKTRFPLTGAHQQVPCAQCHVGGRYTGTPTDCVSCHQAKYQATRNPNHVAAGFPTTCANCHTTNGWTPATFDHNKTRFPLTGLHRSVDCVQCHVGGKYTGTSTDCYACHQGNFQRTTNPSHVAGNFPTTCTSCHTTNGWRPATFSDHNKTRFPLTGRHVAVACAQCHVGGKYTGTPTECVSCHQAKYQATRNPNHVTAGFPTTCASCHTTNGWTPATFDHNKTRFPLTGRHTAVTCAQCHVGGKYTGTSTDCYACHQGNFQRTTNPNHVAGNFPTTCTSCHTTNGWRPASFTDHSKTRFPLTGRHTAVTCAQCHVGGKYTGTPTECVSCHQAKYQATRNPNHVTAGFPTTCASCHTTNGWTPATFDHSKTKFPLTGRHTAVDCAQCHVGGKYAGTPTDCYSCHQAKYQATKNPNHVAAGFPTTCTSCHTTNGWTPATFDHNKTKFPLTGRHRSATCAQCHVGGKYAGTSTDCYACHQAKYNATTNPKHSAAGFPTTCATCHTTNGWTPATFNHTWFPQKHGSARVCADCHTNPGTYQVFECILCHKHANKAEVDKKHQKETGYSYSSVACYRCHPQGRH